MRLVFAIVFLWMGGACLFLASHGVEARTPWGAFQTILTKAAGDG
jgi:hypothetical protein